MHIAESIYMKCYTKQNYDRKWREQGAEWGGGRRRLTSKESDFGGDGNVLYRDWGLVNYMTVCLCQTPSNYIF